LRSAGERFGWTLLTSSVAVLRSLSGYAASPPSRRVAITIACAHAPIRKSSRNAGSASGSSAPRSRSLKRCWTRHSSSLPRSVAAAALARISACVWSATKRSSSSSFAS
jgi:hypothetical protein